MFDKVFTIPPMSDDVMQKLAEEISPDVTMQQTIKHMADGNIGAMNVIKAMFEEDPTMGPLTLGMCAAFDIKGSMLWLLYKDINGQDVVAMMNMITREDEAPRKLSELPYGGFKWPK